MAMDGSAPTHGNGMSTREHWDECLSVFDLGWDVRVMGCRGDSIPFGYPSGQDERIDGGTVHARGDDGWRWVGPPLRMAMECQRENTGMNVPVFLIWGENVRVMGL